MFGNWFGKRETVKTAVVDVHSWVNNALFTISQPEAKIRVGLTWMDKEFIVTDSILAAYNEIADEQFVVSDLTPAFSENIAARNIAILVIADTNETARKFSNRIQELASRFGLVILNRSVSDGATWMDLVTGANGAIDRLALTDYQLAGLRGEQIATSVDY